MPMVRCPQRQLTPPEWAPYSLPGPVYRA